MRLVYFAQWYWNVKTQNQRFVFNSFLRFYKSSSKERIPVSLCMYHTFMPYPLVCQLYIFSTGKSLSEALLFAEHGENMLCTKIVLKVGKKFCTQHVLPRFELGIFMYWTCNSMKNLLSYCGLVDAKIRASDKDLPVLEILLLPYLKKGSKLEYNWLSMGYPLPKLHKMHTYVQISPTNMNVDAINIARRILVFISSLSFFTFLFAYSKDSILRENYFKILRTQMALEL